MSSFKKNSLLGFALAASSQASTELVILEARNSTVEPDNFRHEVSEERPIGLGEVPSECEAECSGVPKKNKKDCLAEEACICHHAFLEGYFQCKQCLIYKSDTPDEEAKENMRVQTNQVIDGMS
ncbi:hypothetical protein BDV98DRAFT_315111 [Pterulicium gracile]|uniref:Uncharacterized protein n=1 Tax=Pterulicium gracile TaxID=1884261 RepID=A0A5C3R103_9AGAR|nr:hypothetical protein BDV98DRAFT_315111 [Pterula gracilis]